MNETNATTPVIVLADVDRSPPDPAWGAAFARLGLAPVCPESADLWWTGPGGGEAAVLAARESLRGEYESVALLGFGAGGHAALRLAYQRPRDFPVVAAWRPAIDCHRLIGGKLPPPPGVTPDAVRGLAALYGLDPERCRQDSAVLHIHPLGWPRFQWIGCPATDPWWEGADRLRMKLRSLGVPAEYALDAQQQTGDPALADRVARWITERLSEASA